MTDKSTPRTYLDDFAAEFGASVEDEFGRVFNALERPISKAAQSVEKPVPSAVEEALKALLTQAQKPPEVHVQAVAPPPAKVFLRPAPIPPPVAWTFEFERNNDGTINRIHATPTHNP